MPQSQYLDDSVQRPLTRMHHSHIIILHEHGTWLLATLLKISFPNIIVDKSFVKH